MRYWVVFLVYVVFVMSYVTYAAQGCSKTEDGIVTGAACCIKDLPKNEDVKTEQDKKVNDEGKKEQPKKIKKNLKK